MQAGRLVLVAVRVLVGTLFIAGLLLNFANVVGRYGFSAPVNWAEEVIIFLMIGFVFLGVVQVSWERTHLRMDIVLQLLPPWAQRVADFLGLVVELVVYAVAIYASFQVATMQVQLGQRSVVAEIPMVVPHAAVLAGFGLSALVVLWRLWARRKEPRKEA